MTAQTASPAWAASPLHAQEGHLPGHERVQLAALASAKDRSEAALIYSPNNYLSFKDACLRARMQACWACRLTRALNQCCAGHWQKGGACSHTGSPHATTPKEVAPLGQQPAGA